MSTPTGIEGQSAGSEAAILGLAGALAQIFAVIALGYFGLRSGYISPSASTGLKQLVGLIGMPALLFEAIAVSDLTVLDARVMLAMLLSKLFVMLLAVGIGVQYDKRVRRAATGGADTLPPIYALDLVGFGHSSKPDVS